MRALGLLATRIFVISLSPAVSVTVGWDDRAEDTLGGVPTFAVLRPPFFFLIDRNVYSAHTVEEPSRQRRGLRHGPFALQYRETGKLVASSLEYIAFGEVPTHFSASLIKLFRVKLYG